MENEKKSETPKTRKPRGFAAMDRAKVSAIASKGGKAAHAAGTAHQFTSEEAREAGKKGGVAPHRSRGRALPRRIEENKPGLEEEDAFTKGEADNMVRGAR